MESNAVAIEELHNGSNETDKTTESNDNFLIKYNKLYFFIYILLFAFHGCVMPLPGTIYIELQNDLNTTTKVISWIYSAMAIGSAISAFFSGYIVHKFTSTHKYLAFIIFLEIISLILIPFIKTIPIMFILFIFIGIGYSAIETFGAVFVFRAFPLNGKRMYFITQTVLSIFSTAMPLFIQLSINKTNNYYIPLFVASVFGVLYILISIFLPTPQHDPLRTLKRKIWKFKIYRSASANDNHEDEDITNLAKYASNKLEQNNSYKYQQHTLVIILLISMLLYATIYFGANSFITTYCSDYLNINELWGRYLISTFWAAVVLYRLLDISLVSIIPSFKTSPMYTVLIAFFMKLIIIIIWISFGNNINITILFILYGLFGFFSSPIYPGFIQWSESVIPINGFISCLFNVSFQCGIALISPIIGSLIQKYSAKILPFILLIPLLIVNLILIINLIIYKKCYKQQEQIAFDSK
eukprot:191129_1